MGYEPGDVIGGLTLIKSYFELDNDKKVKYWHCKCCCGNNVERRQTSLNSAISRNYFSSCGCSHPRRFRFGNKHFSWSGGKYVSGNYYSQIRRNAENRGFKLEVSLEYIDNLFEQQNGLCAISGLPICVNNYQQHQTASLDRIDSSKGYVEGNVWWVHCDVNYMKNKYSLEEFLEMCRAIYNHRIKDKSD